MTAPRCWPCTGSASTQVRP